MATLSVCPQNPTANGRSVCTARPGQRIRSCCRWPCASEKRSPSAAGRWCPAAGTSRPWARWPGAARAHGGRTVGVIPKALVHREVADVDADELVVTDTMRERKQVMEDRADAFIALPGGIGTLEEFFEAWTAGYLGMHDKPVVMLDPIGHYDGLLAWLHGLVDSGYVAEGALDRLVVVDDVEAAMEACAPRGDGGH